MYMVGIASSHSTIKTWQTEIKSQNKKLKPDKFDAIGSLKMN
jgi:hypothetical protein